MACVGCSQLTLRILLRDVAGVTLPLRTSHCRRLANKSFSSTPARTIQTSTRRHVELPGVAHTGEDDVYIPFENAKTPSDQKDDPLITQLPLLFVETQPPPATRTPDDFQLDIELQGELREAMFIEQEPGSKKPQPYQGIQDSKLKRKSKQMVVKSPEPSATVNTRRTSENLKIKARANAQSGLAPATEASSQHGRKTPQEAQKWLKDVQNSFRAVDRNNHEDFQSAKRAFKKAKRTLRRAEEEAEGIHVSRKAKRRAAVAEEEVAHPEREHWMIQKDALKEKFGEKGWAPPRRLSPDALEGIRALHAQYPEHFTTPVLAEKFKMSSEAIRRILKSKWRPSVEEEEDRKGRWDRRGERIWTGLVEKGVHPPKRWREMGIGRGPRRPAQKQRMEERLGKRKVAAEEKPQTSWYKGPRDRTTPSWLKSMAERVSK